MSPSGYFQQIHCGLSLCELHFRIHVLAYIGSAARLIGPNVDVNVERFQSETVGSAHHLEVGPIQSNCLQPRQEIAAPASRRTNECRAARWPLCITPSASSGRSTMTNGPDVACRLQADQPSSTADSSKTIRSCVARKAFSFVLPSRRDSGGSSRWRQDSPAGQPQQGRLVLK